MDSPDGLTMRQRAAEVGFCAKPGQSLWTNDGQLIATLCMLPEGHEGRHEEHGTYSPEAVPMAHSDDQPSTEAKYRAGLEPSAQH